MVLCYLVRLLCTYSDDGNAIGCVTTQIEEAHRYMLKHFKDEYMLTIYDLDVIQDTLYFYLKDLVELADLYDDITWKQEIVAELQYKDWSRKMLVRKQNLERLERMNVKEMKETLSQSKIKFDVTKKEDLKNILFAHYNK